MSIRFVSPYFDFRRKGLKGLAFQRILFQINFLTVDLCVYESEEFSGTGIWPSQGFSILMITQAIPAYSISFFLFWALLIKHCINSSKTVLSFFVIASSRSWITAFRLTLHQDSRELSIPQVVDQAQKRVPLYALLQK